MMQIEKPRVIAEEKENGSIRKLFSCCKYVNCYGSCRTDWNVIRR